MSTNTTVAAKRIAGIIPSFSAPKGDESRFPLFGTTVILFLTAVILYVPPIGWGVPEVTAPDRTKTVATGEILPLETLAEGRNTFAMPTLLPDWWPRPRVDRTFAPPAGLLRGEASNDAEISI